MITDNFSLKKLSKITICYEITGHYRLANVEITLIFRPKYLFMRNRFPNFKKLFVFIILFSSFALFAQENKPATWIWYPGDFEVWLSNKMQVRRTEREAVFPPLWQYYSPYALVTFQTEVDIPQPDEVKIYSEGSFQ